VSLLRIAVTMFSSLILVLATTSCGGDEFGSRAYEIESRDQWVGGPAADAWVGDFILENEYLRVGVLSARCAVEPHTLDGTEIDPDARPDLSGSCSSPGVGLYGGSLVDIDLRRLDGSLSSGAGRDVFSEMFNTVNLDIMETLNVSVLSDGSAGGPAVVRTQGRSGDYISYMGLLGGLLGLPEVWQITDYILEPAAPYLTIRTTAVIVEDDELLSLDDPCGWQGGDEGLPCEQFLIEPELSRIDLVGALNSGGLVFGDFFMAGGDVDIFIPGAGFHEDRVVADSFVAGVNSIEEPFAFPYLGASGDEVSYAVGNGGYLSAPLFTSSLTAVFGAGVRPGLSDKGGTLPFTQQVFTYERYFGVGGGDIGSALDSLLQASVDRGLPMQLGSVSGRVIEDRTMKPLSGVPVLVYRDTGAPSDSLGLPPIEDLFTQWRTDLATDDVADGSFAGRLPAGSYLLISKDPSRAPSLPVSLTVIAGGAVETGVIARRPGGLEVHIRDEAGQAIPAKISLRPLGDAAALSLADLGDPYVAGGLSHVVFAASGSERMELPQGRYQVYVSRGVEYSLWDSAEQGNPAGVLIQAGSSTRIDAVLHREVDSSGYISADLHVHAAPSHDSGVPLTKRVATMACEGVEYVVATDHDVITDYRPALEQMGLDPWLQASSGLEVTGIEVGHYLGFPLLIDHNRPKGGALDWTGLTPTSVIAGVAELGAFSPDETIVYIGHPRDGILGYFDQFGFNPFEGEFLSPELDSPLLNLLGGNELLDEDNFTLDFEAIEILNGKRMDLVRTPTHHEILCNQALAAGEPLPECPEGASLYTMIERTAEEQAGLDAGTHFVTSAMQGQLDDWFSLLNLGYRHTALGNSDTHGTTSIESGCPRNFVSSAVDAPELIDERAVAQAIREHKVVPSYGPLIRASIDGAGVGSDVSAKAGTAEVSIQVQAPRWMDIDRVELYENGRMIHEFVGEDISRGGVVKLETTWPVQPMDDAGTAQDAWYVVVAMGAQSLSPVFTPVGVPKLELNEIVVGALSSLDLSVGGAALAGEAAPFERTYSVFPFAFTNPIWLDVNGDLDGDGNNFEALGRVPEWFRPAPE
jgi:hypothetical protein